MSGSYKSPGETIYIGQVHHMIFERRMDKLIESFEVVCLIQKNLKKKEVQEMI